MTTETDPAADEAEIRRRIDELASALRAHDLDMVMSIYTPGPDQALAVHGSLRAGRGSGR
ncbi:hypothetical protein A5696_20860 [Mycobacterium sp. E2699]|uniref:hypothetical protein n=1 Tax=Mycobacterium sp. E2699 TaxID=1834137 RepID=UPI0007FCB4E2|nr:hypothetical protein [Mycobacterium sp. E2699]OBH07793.1 hypothetical protein A5696_20860 [Mycobacterium sp. E2699]